MGSISDYLELELLDHVFNNGAYSQPNSLYVALSTATVSDNANGLTEPSTTTNYDRVGVDNWDTASGRQIANTDLLTFNQASDSWGTITHYAVCDDFVPGGGNMLAHGQLSTSKSVVAGNTPSIAIREIKLDATSGGMTDYLAEKLLDHVFKNTSYTAPTTVFISLSTSDPGVDGSGISEPSTGENYDRVAHASWETASGGFTENSGDIEFNPASASWGTITYMAICNSLAQGDVLWYDQATPNQEPTAGDTVKFNDGDIEVTLD